MLGIILVASGLSVVIAAVLAQYYAIDVITSLLVSDPRDCTVAGMPHIGLHCFSDYSIVVDLGMRPNAWEPFYANLPGAAGKPAINNYPPTAMLPHLLFGVIGKAFGAPMVGLLGYLLALTAAVLAPAFWAARGARGLETIVVFLACGVAAIPAWAAVDRGNSVGFFTPLALIFLIALSRQRWGLVAVAVVLAAMLKPQFVFLAVIFFAARKWRLGAATVGAAVLLNFAGYLLWPRDFPQTIPQSIHGLSAYAAEAHFLSNVNVALPNAVLAIPYGIAAAIRGETPPPFPGFVHTLAGAAVLLLVAGALIKLGRRIPPTMAGIVLLVTASLDPSISNRYYLVFVLPIAALVVRDPDGAPGTGLFDGFRDRGIYRRSVARCVSVGAALTIAQIPVPGPPTKYETPQLDGKFTTTEFVTTTAHLASTIWLVTCIVIIVAYWRRPAPEDPVEATKESVAQRD